MLKYDPSKHSHNIKKLESGDSFTSVSELTWRIDGGNDEISRKRRGEFPPQKKPSNNKHLDITEYLRSKSSEDVTTPGFNRKEGWNRRVCVFDGKSDSEDEIRKLVARERLRPAGDAFAEDEGNLEVVDDEFSVRRSRPDEEYDSADTDEILTQNKKPRQAEDQKGQKVKTTSFKHVDFDPESGSKSEASGSQTKLKRGVKRIERDSEESKRFRMVENSLETSSSSRQDIKMMGNSTTDEAETAKSSKKPKTMTDQTSQRLSTSCTDSDPESDSEYETMIGNCQTLTLSLADMQDLVKNMNENLSDDETCESEALATSPPISDASREKPGINPEDILASLLSSDEENEDEVKTAALPAFKGNKDLFGSNLKRRAKVIGDVLETSSGSDSLQKSSIKPNKKTKRSSSTSSSASSSDGEDDQPSSDASPAKIVKSAPDSTTSTEGSQTSENDDDESHRVVPIEHDSECVRVKQTETTDRKPIQFPPDQRRQQQDNQRRLAALEQRQKEAEQQKKLIQGALSRVVSTEPL